MRSHIFLPGVDIEQLRPRPEYRVWLQKWLAQVDQELDDGSVAASMCFQGIIAELVLFEGLQHDWKGIVEGYLTDEEGNPLAYSEKFGKRLFGFAEQWRQVEVHAIYERYWIDGVYRVLAGALPRYAALIESFIQPNGWIYNSQVSNTQFRTRMKSEYLMSFAMGLEMLGAASRLVPHKGNFEATVSAEPMTLYLSAEYFRLRALETLGATNLAPVQLAEVVLACEAGEGYCDFSVASKVDDYMGTAKRTSRDVAVHSPLAGLHAQYVSRFCSGEVQQSVAGRLDNFRRHLREKPFNIRAFQIRDVTIPFGTDLSPLEVMAASWLTQDQ